MRSRTIYQKTEGVAETKKWKITAMLVNVTKRVFQKENVKPVKQPSESANTKEVRKKGDWKRTMLVNAMIRIFFFWKTKHDACEAILGINKQQMKEDRK